MSISLFDYKKKFPTLSAQQTNQIHFSSEKLPVIMINFKAKILIIIDSKKKKLLHYLIVFLMIFFFSKLDLSVIRFYTKPKDNTKWKSNVCFGKSERLYRQFLKQDKLLDKNAEVTTNKQTKKNNIHD